MEIWKQKEMRMVGNTNLVKSVVQEKLQVVKKRYGLPILEIDIMPPPLAAVWKESLRKFNYPRWELAHLVVSVERGSEYETSYQTSRRRDSKMLILRFQGEIIIRLKREKEGDWIIYQSPSFLFGYREVVVSGDQVKYCFQYVKSNDPGSADEK